MAHAQATLRNPFSTGLTTVPRKQKPPTFEQALQEFETLVESMERDELTLEESLKKYERGMELSRVCQLALEEAEQRIRILNEKTGKLEPAALADDDGD